MPEMEIDVYIYIEYICNNKVYLILYSLLAFVPLTWETWLTWLYFVHGPSNRSESCHRYPLKGLAGWSCFIRCFLASSLRLGTVGRCVSQAENCRTHDGWPRVHHWLNWLNDKWCWIKCRHPRHGRKSQKLRTLMPCLRAQLHHRLFWRFWWWVRTTSSKLIAPS